MTTPSERIGWILVALPVVTALYAYVGYPAILLVVARRAVGKQEAPVTPPLVTIVIPAYNEEAQIGGCISALLEQDYPPRRRQIIVVSDGSTDGTDQIVREFAPRGVELVRMAERSGKTAAENMSRPHIRGDIVVNSDASVRLHPQAVSRLIENMADPSVGVASTRDVSVVGTGAPSNEAESGYVGYEMWIRDMEARAGGIIGASGSGYAIRAPLHMIPVRADLSRDFSAALNARSHGYRAVSVADALCYVPRTSSLSAEYRRKVRTIRRGMETLLVQRKLLNVFNYGFFSVKLLSHKVCRWMVPALLIPGAAGMVLLAATHVWARGVLVAGMAVCAMAVIGALWPASRPRPRALSVMAFGMAANLAVVHAMLRMIRRSEGRLWEPTRR